MSLQVSSLTEVAETAGELFTRIRGMRDSGRTEKTDEIERAALAMVSRLEEALAASSGPGGAPPPEVREALTAQRRALEERLALADLGLSEEMAVLAQLADLDFKLFAMEIEGTLTWDRLLTGDELERYRGALRRAADQVRRRRKLRAISRSVSAILSIGLGLVSKIVAA